jgi:hemoglobin
MRLLLTFSSFVVLTSSCATTAAPHEAVGAKPAEAAKLYQRLGGQPAVEAVVDDFVGRLAKDERVNATFAGSHVPRLRKRLVELVCFATGGPCTYSGRDMKTVHTGMNITHASFDIVVGHLVATLERFKVPAGEKSELLGLLGPMRSDIVEEP